MSGIERRNEICRILSESEVPVSAAALAAKFSVSRQVIVGDIALLRAAGTEVAATPRGYLLPQTEEGMTCTIACVHDFEGMEKELQIIVDNGCSALDVMVEHPVYGVLTGQLSVASRYDLREFMKTVEKYGAKPLSDLTDGVHFHRMKCPNREAMDRVLAELRKAGILIENEY